MQVPVIFLWAKTESKVTFSITLLYLPNLQKNLQIIDCCQKGSAILLVPSLMTCKAPALQSMQRRSLLAITCSLSVSQMVPIRQDQIITPPDEFLPLRHDPVKLARLTKPLYTHSLKMAFSSITPICYFIFPSLLDLCISKQFQFNL